MHATLGSTGWGRITINTIDSRLTVTVCVCVYALLLTLHTLLYLPPSASFDSSNSALRISVLPHLFTLSRQVSRSRPRHFKGSAPLLLFSLILFPAKFQNFSSSTISIRNLRDSIRNNSNRTGEIKFIKLITRQICCFCAFYRTVSNYAQTSVPSPIYPSRVSR